MNMDKVSFIVRFRQTPVLNPSICEDQTSTRLIENESSIAACKSFNEASKAILPDKCDLNLR
eukprot:snap_masked-scaffold_22-processed-gene-5.28-mRNA-1 protein AED:1.00 eAED:1.00 QI:0/-1/0/0/-1/1/1/0/61